jgi:hypothetical protein
MIIMTVAVTGDISPSTAALATGLAEFDSSVIMTIMVGDPSSFFDSH